jgi:transcriptional regulator GlxA family with amidase domain
MKAPTVTVDARVTAAVDYMQRYLAEPIRAAALAERANLSPSRFRHLFVGQTGVAPAQYLQRLRLRRARLLLEGTFLTVKEVMALVGYNDPSHFAREFRRSHGVPPSTLRGSKAALPPEGGSAVVLAMSKQAKRPMHRRIRQVKARDPGTRCA